MATPPFTIAIIGAAGREKVAEIVTILTQYLPPIAIFDILIGPAIHIARRTLGDAITRSYFEKVVEELGRDQPTKQ